VCGEGGADADVIAAPATQPGGAICRSSAVPRRTSRRRGPVVDIPAAAAVHKRRLAGHAGCRPLVGIVTGRALRDAVEGDADRGCAVAVHGFPLRERGDGESGPPTGAACRSAKDARVGVAGPRLVRPAPSRLAWFWLWMVRALCRRW